MQSMTIGRGKGRPRKQLVEPSLEGYPADESEEEKKRWLRMKCSEMWRYNVLTSDRAEEYREKEKARCKAAYHAKKAGKGRGKQSAASGVVGAPVILDTTDDKEEKAKEQSRLRYVKFVKYVKSIIFVVNILSLSNKTIILKYQYLMICYFIFKILCLRFVVVVKTRLQRKTKPPSPNLVLREEEEQEVVIQELLKLQKSCKLILLCI